MEGELDEFGAAPAMEEFVKSLTGPVEMVIIPGAAHQVVDVVVDCVGREPASA